MFKMKQISACFSLALPLFLLPTLSTQAEEITFDSGILTARGLSPELNHYFSQAPRFLPGTHSVQIKVNNKDLGTAAVRFDEKGTLCVDNNFLEFASLVPVTLKAGETCHDIRSDYSAAVVKALPNKGSVELYLPQEAVSSDATNIKNFRYGGSAGMLNYSLFSTTSQQNGTGSHRYNQASLEGGINFADWSLRSRYILTDDNGHKSADSLYTYGEHVFAAQKMTLQAGEINAASALFSGAPIVGVQLMPTMGLQGGGSGVNVSGIARSAQARVEVRQTGQLVYSTLVPAGPFTLNDVPVVRSNADLDVKVVETDGSTNHFIIPASAVNAQRLSRPQGLMISAGRVHDIEGDYANPLALNLSNGWHISPQLNLLASGVMAENYQATGGDGRVFVYG